MKIPFGLKTIGEAAFHRCRELPQIELPSSVTSIGKQAFYDCLCLTEIYLPKSITEIQEYAFMSCFGLRNVYSFSTTPQPIKNAFINYKTEKMILHVPTGCKSVYEATEGWDVFTIIEDIPEGIQTITMENFDLEFYTTDGRRVNEMQNGINIIRREDGKTMKVLKK